MRKSGTHVWATKATTFSTVPVGLVFDKSQIGIRLGRGSTHEAMIPLLCNKGSDAD
jgi:hypothetical protein